MNHLTRILSILRFLGDDITEAQCNRLMLDMRINLYPSEISRVKNNPICQAIVYNEITMYQREIDGQPREDND